MAGDSLIQPVARTAISAGLAALDVECANVETLPARADKALYAAKQAGKKTSVWRD